MTIIMFPEEDDWMMYVGHLRERLPDETSCKLVVGPAGRSLPRIATAGAEHTGTASQTAPSASLHAEAPVVAAGLRNKKCDSPIAPVLHAELAAQRHAAAAALANTSKHPVTPCSAPQMRQAYHIHSREQQAAVTSSPCLVPIP